MWGRRKKRETTSERFYRAYDQKYPWLWELIRNFRHTAPERFVITREQYHVLLEEPCSHVTAHATEFGRSPYKFVRGHEWIAKTDLGVPIYIEGFAPPKQLEIDFSAPPKQLKLVW